MPAAPPLASVDEVREELRRLGYFQSGLDRFVLSGTTPRSLAAASLRAALRVGLIGGVVFGTVLSLAGLGLDPRFQASRQDLAVLTLYLIVIFGAATGAAAFVGGYAAGFWGRRRGRLAAPSLSRNVGIALGIAGVTYFALWWRSHALKAPVAFQLVASLLGMSLCLVLARFGFLASVAVLSAAGLSDRLPEAGLSRSRVLLLLCLVVLLSGIGIVALSYGARGGAAAPDFAVVPTGLRVRVVGIDGLDAHMAEQMMAAGEMPHLRALMEQGARGHLAAEPEQIPAIVWTTIATGRGPEAHGIRSAGARRLAGMRSPLAVGEESRLVRAVAAATDLLRLTRSQPPTSVLRSVKTFWNVASEKGLRVAVVNWWASWPADSVNGSLVTDRAFFKLEKGGLPDRDAFPLELFDRLRLLPAPPERENRPRRIDSFHWAVARMLRSSGPSDLEAVYLPGLDIATMQQLGESGGADLATLDARLAAVKAHYRFVDGLVGEALASQKTSDLLMIVGDPGRLARQGQVRGEGLVVLAGSVVARGPIGVVAERDIAPTVLHLLGLPVSQELEGHVIETALRADFRQQTPVRLVASYGRRPQAPPAESGFDREMLEELRSLGYIR
jgi:hypothetical protein